MADDTQKEEPLAAGQFCWYVRGSEPQVRPAMLVSDGIVERKKEFVNGRMIEWQYATLDFGTVDENHMFLGFPSTTKDPLEAARTRQTQQVTAPWSGDGIPNSWHLDSDVEHVKAVRAGMGLPELKWPAKAPAYTGAGTPKTPPPGQEKK